MEEYRHLTSHSSRTSPADHQPVVQQSTCTTLATSPPAGSRTRHAPPSTGISSVTITPTQSSLLRQSEIQSPTNTGAENAGLSTSESSLYYDSDIDTTTTPTQSRYRSCFHGISPVNNQSEARLSLGHNTRSRPNQTARDTSQSPLEYSHSDATPSPHASSRLSKSLHQSSVSPVSRRVSLHQNPATPTRPHPLTNSTQATPRYNSLAPKNFFSRPQEEVSGSDSDFSE